MKRINVTKTLHWIVLIVALLIVRAASAQSLTITTTSLPNGVVGVPYSQTLQASGVTGPLTWVLTAGSFPGGLSLSTSTGVVSGTPNTQGTFTIFVRVSDGTSTAPAAPGQQLFITIGPGPAIITTALPNGSIGTAYSQAVVAAGGVGAKTWSVSSGSLPPGLGLGASTGVISGTPTTAGTFGFNITVTDVASNQATQSLSITVVGGPVITTTSLPNAQAGTPYSQQLQVSGGAPPFTWTLSSGGLPAGLALGASTGVISGTPTTQGTSNFSVRVTDAFGFQATAGFSITVSTVAGPVITTASLPNGFLTVAYSRQLQASGGVAPLTWAISAGALPPGLALNAASGVIAGTPTSAGTFDFTVRVSDNLGSQATKALSIVVGSGPVIITTTLPDAEVGRPYSQQLQAAGGTAPITWTISASALPTGLTLNSGGAITGSPASVGTASFRVQATDATSASATQDLSITVSAPAAGVLQFGSADFSVDENGGSATVTVLRTGGSSGAVTAVVSTGRGSASLGVDYALTIKTVTFDDGNNTPKEIAIPIADDTFSEGLETIELALSNAGGGVLLGPRSSATLTIVDNETGAGGGGSGGGGGGGGGGGCAVNAAARDGSLLALLMVALGVRGWRGRRARCKQRVE